MISCTDFIPAYNELFKYIDQNYGHDHVLKFWDYLFKPDGKGIPLINYLKKDGLKGAFDYWVMISDEEACDVTRTINVKQGWLKNHMEYCPSKGRLLKLKEELGIEPYAYYCDHCDYYRAALKEVGLEYIRDHTCVDRASCSSMIIDPTVFRGKLDKDENTIVATFSSDGKEYFHPDFHSSLNMGVEYLGITYGEEAIKDFLRKYTKAVYRKVIDSSRQKGLTVLQEMILDTYKREHALDAIAVDLDDNVLSVQIHYCPAVHHLTKTGRTVTHWFSLTTSVVMETIATECGYHFDMGTYDPETGKTSFQFS